MHEYLSQRTLLPISSSPIITAGLRISWYIAVLPRQSWFYVYPHNCFARVVGDGSICISDFCVHAQCICRMQMLHTSQWQEYDIISLSSDVARHLHTCITFACSHRGLEVRMFCLVWTALSFPFRLQNRLKGPGLFSVYTSIIVQMNNFRSFSIPVPRSLAYPSMHSFAVCQKPRRGQTRRSALPNQLSVWLATKSVDFSRHVLVRYV